MPKKKNDSVEIEFINRKPKKENVGAGILSAQTRQFQEQKD